MLIAIIPLVVALIGLFVYALAANPKAQELGRLAFACGLLVSLFAMAGRSVRLL